MTLEQMIVMGVALAILLFRALDQSERELQREEHLEDLREAGEIPCQRGRHLAPRATVGPTSAVDGAA